MSNDRANVGDQPSGMDQRAYAKKQRRSPIHSALATTGYVLKAETARQSQSSRGFVDTYRGSQFFQMNLDQATHPLFVLESWEAGQALILCRRPK
jgi:hypothetical protein